MTKFFLAVLFLPLLAACGGGGASTSSTLPHTGAFTQPAALSQTAPASAGSSSGSNDLLYVGNTGNNSITVYWHAASGNTAPLYVIAGSRTGISSPGQLSADAQGNLYVANGSILNGGTNPGILVFAHGANGNVAPIRRIASPLIQNVLAMTVDKLSGKIFVAANSGPSGSSSSLLVFPPNANGNAAPLVTGTMDFVAIQLAFDSSNQNLIVAHSWACCNWAGAGVETYRKQFTNNSYLTGVTAIDTFMAEGVADDPTTKTYLSATNFDGNVGLYRFAESTTGHGADQQYGHPAAFNPSPSIVTNDTCGSQLAVAPGPTPYTYVVHGTEANSSLLRLTGCPSDAVYVYTNSALGKALPLRILSGPATKLNQPYGIYEGP